MRNRRFLALVAATCGVVLGLASPAGAATRASGLAAAALPACTLASPENITGATFMNGQFLNGTWHYATGVACTGNLADIALYEELDFNGTKVDSKLKNFTGVARPLDAITSSVPCSVCNGTWVFKWGQILKATGAFLFTTPTAGCILLQNGLYELCVQTKSVTL